MVFMIDLPVSLVFFSLGHVVPDLLVFLILGGAWWFLIGIALGAIVVAIKNRGWK